MTYVHDLKTGFRTELKYWEMLHGRFPGPNEITSNEQLAKGQKAVEEPKPRVRKDVGFGPETRAATDEADRRKPEEQAKRQQEADRRKAEEQAKRREEADREAADRVREERARDEQ
ncbi:hypothetical protein [Streptomyces sp. NPDC007205]|uniref:hypothetical protein n=1 Tax=Streptomyces sp. NPDC007205 TaxID=3154316 RepID=UPI0033DE0160